jgi:hypothetical protein
MLRRAFLLLAVLAAAALAAFLVARALRTPPGDEERIRTLLREAAAAAEEKRIDGVVRDLSEGFEGQGLDRRDARRLVAFHVLRGSWVSVQVAGDAVRVEGDRARAVVDVVLSRSGKGTPLAELLPETASVHRFDLRLAREEGGWKVTGAAWRPVPLQDAVKGPSLGP